MSLLNNDDDNGQRLTFFNNLTQAEKLKRLSSSEEKSNRIRKSLSKKNHTLIKGNVMIICYLTS